MSFPMINQRTKSMSSLSALDSLLNTFSTFLQPNLTRTTFIFVSTREQLHSFDFAETSDKFVSLFVKISSTQIIRHSSFFIICRENQKTKRKTTNVCLCNDLFFDDEEFHHRSSLFDNKTTLIRCSRSNLSSDENRRRVEEKSIG